MKKLISYLLILFTVFMFGCGKSSAPNDTVSDSAGSDALQLSEDINEPKTNEFCEMMDSDVRPVAVMIDNDNSSARPQIGLESAYMVYEITVEGGATRFMALFKNHNIEKVGPVRSSRHYFLDYALEHDAIYCHAGWSPRAQSDISTLKVNNINGLLGDDGTVYWRDNTYDRTWHNLYTGVDKLFKKATETKGYRDTTDVTHNKYSNVDIVPEDGEDVTQINIPYSTMYKVAYSYDEENMVYTRYINGSEHMSQTGNALTAKNIIIYKLKNYSLDSYDRQELENIGSGNGYYITNGKAIEIKWSKSSRTGKTLYTTEDGEELILNPGNTFVQIIPVNSNLTLS